MLTKSSDSFSRTGRTNMSWILQNLTVTASSPVISEIATDLAGSPGFSTDPFLVYMFSQVGDILHNIWKAPHWTVQSTRI